MQQRNFSTSPPQHVHVRHDVCDVAVSVKDGQPVHQLAPITLPKKHVPAAASNQQHQQQQQQQECGSSKSYLHLLKTEHRQCSWLVKDVLTCLFSQPHEISCRMH
jgi:hypothetical protein